MPIVEVGTWGKTNNKEGEKEIPGSRLNDKGAVRGQREGLESGAGHVGLQQDAWADTHIHGGTARE